MRKAEVQVSLKKGPGDEAAPPSPVIPPKRSKASLEQVSPEAAGQRGRPTPTPPIFTRKMRNAAVGTGCDIRLKVTVAGDPQPSLYWYHNDELLDMENQEYGGLWIRDCKPSDAGLYTCIANNHLGEVRSSAVLAVLDLGEGKKKTKKKNHKIPFESEKARVVESPEDKVQCAWIFTFHQAGLRSCSATQKSQIRQGSRHQQSHHFNPG